MSAMPQLELEFMPMNLRDLAEVMAIETEVYPFPWTRGNFADSLDAGDRVRGPRRGGYGAARAARSARENRGRGRGRGLVEGQPAGRRVGPVSLTGSPVPPGSAPRRPSRRPRAALDRGRAGCYSCAPAREPGG